MQLNRLSTKTAVWIREVLEELEELLATNPDNEELEIFLSEAGCEYDPRGDGWNELEWLQHIQARLRMKVG